MGSNSQIRKNEFSESRTTMDDNPFNEEAPELPAHLKGIYFLNVLLLFRRVFFNIEIRKEIRKKKKKRN